MSGIVEGNPLVHEHANTPSSHSHFDLNSVLGGTYRFGELSPHFVLSAVADDKRASFMSGSDVRSLNLKSPLLQDVKMFKTYFQVPMPAILPLNWDKLYVQPNIGDDVVASDVGTTVEEFTDKVSALNSAWLTYLQTLVTYDDQGVDKIHWDSTTISSLFRWLTWMKSIFSAGSLASQFGDNFWNLFHWYKSGDDESYEYKYFDEFYDYVVKRVFQKIVGTLDYEFFVFDGTTAFYKVLNTLNDEDCGKSYEYHSGNWCNTISIRRFIEIIDNNPSFTLIVKDNYNNPNTVYIDDDFIFDSDLEYGIVGNIGRSVPSLSLNIDKYVAYQLSCAEYFTNDKVDYVYSSELYRQLVLSSLKEYSLNSNYNLYSWDDTFTYNGQSYLYDAFSAYNLSTVLTDIYNCFSSGYPDVSTYFLNYWMLIFGIRNSLRYKDYFVGAKTRPLAPVDVDVPVVSNKVSMVDVAVKKGYLRLAFAVNRIGRKFSKYSEEIMHTAPPVDYHHAWYLAETTDYIGNQETENTTQTSASTNASTTISTLRSQSNRYAFETDIDINSIIIGITSFDINRLYDRTYSRFNTHFDRYDMFNPLLQFTGDQPVYSFEYDSGSDPSLYLGYQDKYMEYKMPISRCFGGLDLPRILPGWCIVATDRQNVNGNTLLSPSFIRSYPHEFDKFYSSLTGLSLATYFHFIIKHSNVLSINRPMVAKPKIM